MINEVRKATISWELFHGNIVVAFLPTYSLRTQGHCTKIVFSVKWSASGLAPIRPQVVLTQDVELPPGRCLSLF